MEDCATDLQRTQWRFYNLTVDRGHHFAAPVQRQAVQQCSNGGNQAALPKGTFSFGSRGIACRRDQDKTETDASKPLSPGAFTASDVRVSRPPPHICQLCPTVLALQHTTLAQLSFLSLGSEMKTTHFWKESCSRNEPWSNHVPVNTDAKVPTSGCGPAALPRGCAETVP
jgi:hypothetical protein